MKIAPALERALRLSGVRALHFAAPTLTRPALLLAYCANLPLPAEDFAALLRYPDLEPISTGALG